MGDSPIVLEQRMSEEKSTPSDSQQLGFIEQPPPPGYQESPLPPGYTESSASEKPPTPPGFTSGMEQIDQNRQIRDLGTARGIGAENLPPAEVVWMPAPSAFPSGCPPGLEYLCEIDQVLVHQQIELLELVTDYETENRYRIRNTLGQQVYFAAERSSEFQRQCCGAGRKFSMSIIDNQQREVIRLERPEQCYWNWGSLVCYCFCCCTCLAPQLIEVQAPPGTVVGYVKQDPWAVCNPWFSILNAEEELVMKIKGPWLGCTEWFSDTDFQVLGADGVTEVGKISKQWGGLAKEIFTDADNFGIQFPMDLDVKMKAVMLGACFLIDYNFFEAHD